MSLPHHDQHDERSRPRWPTKNRCVILVGVVLLLFVVVEATRQVASAFVLDLPAETRAAKHSDIEYGQKAEEKLLLDVSVPAGDGPFPIAIVVHGGGWTGGDKASADNEPMFELLSEANFTWFSINYRLAPNHRWPACLDDVQTAIRWVKANATKFKGDPAQIALIGYSAGGHLVCCAATLVDDSVRVQAVVGYSALTDFEQELPMRGNVVGRAQQGLLNRPQELTPETLGQLRALSPINHVRPGLPPFLLLHGDADKSVPFEQSVAFQAKLRANGVRCDLIKLPEAPHRLTEWNKFVPDHAARTTKWLRETLAEAIAQP